MRAIISALQLAVLIPLALGSLFVAVMLGAWIADRREPVRVDSFRVITPEVGPGGELQIEFNVTYLRSCKLHADRIMTDSARHRTVLTDTDFERPPGDIGKPQRFIVTERVPSYFTDGPAVLITRPWYACNPLQEFIWPMVPQGITAPFTVKTP